MRCSSKKSEGVRSGRLLTKRLLCTEPILFVTAVLVAALGPVPVRKLRNLVV